MEQVKVEGYQFSQNLNFEKLIDSFKNQGIQSSNISKAIQILNNVLELKKNDSNVKIFLGYTSNMISSGIREILRFLCQHKLIDAIVTTCGGIEEDIMKCYTPAYVGNFRNDDYQLRNDGINRIGNMYVPNENYCKFEDFFIELLKELYQRQQNNKEYFTPSKIIEEMGKKVNHEDSVYYWCYKNNIPVFCPAITDGAVGDALFFQSYKDENFIVDLTQDVISFYQMFQNSSKTAGLILGGGLIKHHIMEASTIVNGLDYCVLINNGLVYDGSDSGANKETELSQQRIKKNCEYVKIFTEITLVFPIIVAKTFAKEIQNNQLLIQICMQQIIRLSKMWVIFKENNKSLKINMNNIILYMNLFILCLILKQS